MTHSTKDPEPTAASHLQVVHLCNARPHSIVFAYGVRTKPCWKAAAYGPDTFLTAVGLLYNNVCVCVEGGGGGATPT